MTMDTPKPVKPWDWMKHSRGRRKNAPLEQYRPKVYYYKVTDFKECRGCRNWMHPKQTMCGYCFFYVRADVHRKGLQSKRA